MATMKLSNENIFLFSSFLSSMGDALLIFAVPVGLGIETNDMRSSVLMWLIPAVAMFLSSFLKAKLIKREKSTRVDYSKLLISLAILEIIIATISFFFNGKIETLLIVSIFVFLYAFAKEGIPRLLYLVAVYRYFISPEKYSKLAFKSNSLNIVASLLGSFFAGFLILYSNWRISLVIDAITFLVLGISILCFGSEPEIVKNTTLKNDETADPNLLKIILSVVPILFGLNAIAINYLPILASKKGLSSAVINIFVISILRFPGIVLGLLYFKLKKYLSFKNLIIALPLIYVTTSILLFQFFNNFMFYTFVIFQGIITGLYWPADTSIRNLIPNQKLIQFNANVLRKLAIFQFCSCLFALYIFTPGYEQRLNFIIPAMITIVILSFAHSYISFKKIYSIFLLLTLGTIFPSCSSKKSNTHIQVPSISKDLSLRSDLTYAAMLILNDTSAHFMKISTDLIFSSDVLSSFKNIKENKEFLLEVNSRYKSYRNETLNAEDFAFTIKYYISNKKEIAGPLLKIQGADNCLSIDCKISGLEIINNSQIKIILSKPDVHFLDRLASPWLIIFKKDHPQIEKIGDCLVPYQTGKSLVKSCDNLGIHISIGEKNILISNKENTSKDFISKKLSTTNTGNFISPTLTVMSAFSNPSSKMTFNERFSIMSLIRYKSDELSKMLMLKKSNLFTPEWMAIAFDKDFLNVKMPQQIHCPKSPIKFLLDTSLPDIEKLKNFFKKNIPCPIDFLITDADKYFVNFAQADIGLCWFTPDSLDLKDAYSSIDCSAGGSCYFNWKDKDLQNSVDKINKSSELGNSDKAEALEIERLLYKKGFIAPLVEMNWWITDESSSKAIHPAGLFQVKASDFL